MTKSTGILGSWRTILAVVLAIGAPIAWGALGPLMAPQLGAAVGRMGTLGPVGFAAAGAIFIALCAPTSLLYMTGGMVFGVMGGTLWGTLAGVLGSLLCYGIARSTMGRRVARALTKHSRLDRFERGLSEHGLWLTLLLRLSLLFPIGPVSYGLGLSRIPARYFLLSMPALIPSVFAYSYAGDLAHAVFAPAPRARDAWEWALGALGLLASAGAAWMVGRAANRALSRHAPDPKRPRYRHRITQPGTADTSDLFPPKRTDREGNPRTVGVEVEFAALDLQTASRTINTMFGGKIEPVHEYMMRVTGTSLGDFRVEVDSHALQDLAKKRGRNAPIRLYERLKGVVLNAVADTLTPHELSTSPIIFEQLAEVDRLVHALGRAGAEGTEDSILHVLGVHFNPSIASSDPRELRDYIRAYVLLHDELVEALHVDPKRRVMRFATAYPMAYALKVLDPDYDPDLTQLIDDYLEHNSTRNRGLDLLPLFAHLDLERVRTAVNDPRVTGRPTFHFRLPNSEISNPIWRVTDEWRLWLEVEELASDPARIAAVSRDARAQFELPSPLRNKWHALRRTPRFLASDR